MSLIRTSFWNGIAVSVRIVTALALNKILAVFVGPAGYATIGQFQNAMTMAISVATAGVGNGVTKATAEHFDDEPRQRGLWRTAGTLVIGGSILTAVPLIAFRTELARLVLRDESLSGAFVWFAVSLVFIALNALLLAMLNGKKEVRRYVVSNIAGSLLGLAVVGMLTWRYGLYGALVAFGAYQGVVFFVTLWQALGTAWFRLGDLVGRIDAGHLRTLAKFFVMAATTAIAVPLSQIFVRSRLGADFGWDYAGYWDAMWRISSLYLTLVTTTLTLYYLPRIAEIRAWPELRGEMLQAYRIVVPVVAAAALAMFLLRDMLIWLLFTPDFAPMRQLFAWQLAGDVVKVAAWLVAFVMVGKGLTTLYVVTEVGSAVLFVAMARVLTSIYGFEGVAMAHFVNYAVYGLAVYGLTVSTAARREALFRQGSA